MSRMLAQRGQLLALLSLLYPAAAHAQSPEPDDAEAPALPSSAEAEATPNSVSPSESAAPPVAAPPAAEEAAPTAPAEPSSTASETSTRKMDLSMPPPPPPRTRQARVHNGFYLRGSFGAGGLWPSLSDRSDAATRFDANGSTFSLNFEALVGASPADGFALGGGAAWAGGTSGLTAEGVDASISTMLLGVFFDAFPRPKEGMHLGAMAGYALHFIDDHPSGVERTGGIGGAAWLGYDWWVADEISAGLMLRFNGALTRGEEDVGSLRVNSTGLSILATALYH